MAYDEYIDVLKEGPKTPKELAERLHYSIRTIWSACDELEKVEVITKSRPAKGVTYSLNPEYFRSMPRIRISRGEERGYANLSELVWLKDTVTKSDGIKALLFVPVLAARLLVIGLKAQRAYEKMDTKSQTKLNRELKELRLEVNHHFTNLQNAFSALKQIKENEGFWTLEGLRSHYDPQLDIKGNAIPPIDSVKALEIYQQLQE